MNPTPENSTKGSVEIIVFVPCSQHERFDSAVKSVDPSSMCMFIQQNTSGSFYSIYLTEDELLVMKLTLDPKCRFYNRYNSYTTQL